jgi:hypothetical protein
MFLHRPPVDHSPVDRIRVAIVDVPRMLRDIVESVVTRESDLEVVDSGTHEADVTIVGLARAEDAQRYASLLYARPRHRVLALVADGREAYLYELRPHLAPLGAIAPDGLLAAIRLVAHVGTA